MAGRTFRALVHYLFLNMKSLGLQQKGLPRRVEEPGCPEKALRSADAASRNQVSQIRALLTLIIRNMPGALLLSLRNVQQRGSPVTEVNKDEKVVVARSSFNVANVIAAIALLLLVLGLLKWMGVSPL